MQSLWRSICKAGIIRRSLLLTASQGARFPYHQPIKANCSTSHLNIQEFLKAPPIDYAQNRYMGKHLMKIIQTKKAFYFEVDNGRAVLTYDVRDGVMTIKHTRVPKELGGRGLGKLLAKVALEYALRNGLFLVIKCKFVNHYIDKYEPQYAKYMLR